MIKPQVELSGNSNVHFVFAEKLYENSNKINSGKKIDQSLAKENPNLNQSVHAFLIRTVRSGVTKHRNGTECIGMTRNVPERAGMKRNDTRMTHNNKER